MEKYEPGQWADVIRQGGGVGSAAPITGSSGASGGGAPTEGTLLIVANADDVLDLDGVLDDSISEVGVAGKVDKDTGFMWFGTSDNPLPTQGVTITKADVTPDVYQLDIGTVQIKVHGFDADDPNDWLTDGPATAAATTEVITTTIAATGVVTYDCIAIVQELVDRGSWVGGETGSLGILILANAGVSTHIAKFEDLERANGKEAKIELEWTI